MTVNDNCTTDAATHRCIKVAHSNPDGSWTDLPNILNPPNPIFIAFPLIDAADNISVIFIPQSSSESEIFASRYSPITKTWDDAPKSIYSKNNNNNTTMTFGDFDAELAQDGSIRIIWTESDGTNYFFKTLNFD
jgi:hypothetical protein